jgi:endonuclease/exonuclease/phosphatase family metal-dependent hydrolase
MCTRSDYVRGLQGAEVVELVNSLIEQYNVPVMFGGDYNGSIKSANYAEFVNGGMINVQREKLGSIYNSVATSHHTYPEFDQTYKICVPAAGDTAGATNIDNNIDHIMVKNHETMNITVYGVVIDDMSISSADHLPIFIDFSITPTEAEEAE